MASNKNYTVQHTMLGSINPETSENHRQGQVVPAEQLGDEANIRRHLRNGAITESTQEEIDAAELTKENARNEKALRDAEASGDGKAYAEALAKVTTGNDKTAKQARKPENATEGQG
jgi:hypothetical protein